MRPYFQIHVESNQVKKSGKSLTVCITKLLILNVSFPCALNKIVALIRDFSKWSFQIHETGVGKKKGDKNNYKPTYLLGNS